MCGHIGIINRENTIQKSEKLLKFFYQGLYCDAVRGQHGTGICAVEGDGTYRMFKRALNSSDFLELSTAKKILSDNDNVFLMGHNRHATYGSHTDDNTHPFVNDNITLFHNGTLTGHSQLTPGKIFGVDSDALSYMLSQSTNIARDLEDVKGAYALVWYDEYEKSINFARNSDRTFYFGYIKDSTSILYASEEGLIQWLANRNGIELERVVPLLAGNLVSISLKADAKMKIKHFTPYTASVPSYSGYYSNKYTKPPVIGDLKTNDIIAVEVLSWHSYNNTAPSLNIPKFGYLKCQYKSDTYFHMSGVCETDHEKYLDKKYSLKILSITANNLGYGTLLTELTEEEFIAAKLKDLKDSEGDKVITIYSKKEEKSQNDLGNQKDQDLKKIGYTPLTKEEIDTTDYSLVKGPGRTYISETEFLKKVQGGCCNCTDDILIMDAEKTFWDYEGNPYCPECAEFYNID